MEKCNDIAEYLLNGGLTASERINELLNPDNISIVHFGVEDWIEFTHTFAKGVKFFKNDDQTSLGNWQSYFDFANNNKSILEDYKDGDLPANITLFLAFLKLLNYSKDSINQLTKRQLDFYYRKVLKLENRAYEPDKVFNSFTLNKNVDSFILPKDTELNGSKCDLGKIRLYKTQEEVSLNQIRITNFRNWYSDENGVFKTESEEIDKLKLDYPFGNPTNEEGDYGFSVSSPSLFLKEGIRKITILISFNENLSPQLQNTELSQGIRLQYSGAKKWVDIGKSHFKTNGNEITIETSLDETMAALIAPTMELHNRVVENPVIKILFKNKEGKSIFNNWMNYSLSNIKITTVCDYSKNLIVKSDQGELDPTNEFYPFGSVPKKGSKLKIHSDEWVNKKITNASLKIDWKDLPNDFAKHYRAYYKNYFDDNFRLLKYNGNQKYIVTETDGSDRFTVKTMDGSSKPLFNDFNTRSSEFIKFNLPIKYNPNSKEDYLTLQLENDFCHNVYGTISTIAVSMKNRLPQAPYAPLAEKISVNIITESEYKSNDTSLIWEFPYGYKTLTETSNQLLPDFNNQNGEFIIGIDNAIENQQFQFLLKLDEGSENPESLNSNGLNKINWYYLNENNWKPLTEKNILKNDIDNFLQAGLLKFIIPSFASENTLLPSGKLWIKATLNNKFDTVCKINGIHSQSLLSEFSNNENGLSHLKKGIESETISKLINRKAQVKKIEQNYPSFGARPEETDEHFYTRVSERLRHKGRCVSNLDYNQIVLEYFPSIYKVKTINHSFSLASKHKYIQPGEVLIAVIPQLKNKTVYDILKPTLSQAKLNKIEKYVNTLNSLHVDAKVVSPKYISIQICADVKFYKQFDAYTYSKKLASDITKHFAPWAYDTDSIVTFGGSIYYSQIVHFLEKLSYVDYVKNLQLKANGIPVKFVKSEDPIQIITSVPETEHEIKILKESICTV